MDHADTVKIPKQVRGPLDPVRCSWLVLCYKPTDDSRTVPEVGAPILASNNGVPHSSPNALDEGPETPCISRISFDPAVHTTLSDYLQVSFVLLEISDRHYIVGTGSFSASVISKKQRNCILKVKALKSQKKQSNNNFDLVSAVHASEYMNIKAPLEPSHRFEVTIESNDFTEEKYALFEQYQRLVHKEGPEKISQHSFRRFLCESPLIETTIQQEDGTVKALGSFHQCYRLNGQLIALGVIDLLPSAVSAVYFIYDVSYERWSFGKLSALREAALALEAGYGYYNMGFYIHSCPKMRYKCDYKPQFLLDPDTYEWHQLDEAMKTKLDSRRFVSPSRDRMAETLDMLENGANGYSTNGSPRESLRHANRATEKFSSPSEAYNSKEPLIAFGMPGIMSMEEVNEEFEEYVPLVGVEQATVSARQLVAWNDEPLTEDSEFIKLVIADLVACVGSEMAREMIVDFT